MYETPLERISDWQERVGEAALKKEYVLLLSKLEVHLRSYQLHPNPDDAFFVGERVRWLQELHQAPWVVRAIRAYCNYPNVVVAVPWYLHDMRINSGAKTLLGSALDKPSEPVEPGWPVLRQGMRHVSMTSGLQMLGEQAYLGQLGAMSAPSTVVLAKDDAMVAQIHESAINNLFADVFGGMLMDYDELGDTWQQLLSPITNQFAEWSEKADNPGLVERIRSLEAKDEEFTTTFRFAFREPIIVRFEHGGMDITVKISRFTRTNSADGSTMSNSGMDVSVRYIQVLGLKLVRKDISVFPPGFHPNTGMKMTARMLAIATVVKRRMQKVFLPEIDLRGIFGGMNLVSDRGGSIHLTLDQVALDQGWMTMRWKKGTLSRWENWNMLQRENWKRAHAGTPAIVPPAPRAPAPPRPAP